jgi:hypothetical protein
MVEITIRQPQEIKGGKRNRTVCCGSSVQHLVSERQAMLVPRVLYALAEISSGGHPT